MVGIRAWLYFKPYLWLPSPCGSKPCLRKNSVLSSLAPIVDLPLTLVLLVHVPGDRKDAEEGEGEQGLRRSLDVDFPPGIADWVLHEPEEVLEHSSLVSSVDMLVGALR